MSPSSLFVSLAVAATLVLPPAYTHAAGRRLLVDSAHVENYSTTGFTDYLKSLGWTVATNTSPVTDAVLKNYDALLVPVAYSGSITPFSASEVTAIKAWLSQGRGLWLLHKQATDPSGINSLATAFGVTFQNATVADDIDNTGPPFLAPLITSLTSHEVLADVNAFGLYLGACLSATAPAQVVATAGANATSDACSGSIPALAVSSWGDGGRIACLPDVLPMHPSTWNVSTTEDDERLYVNIANWITHQPTPVEPATWGGIKSLYR